ncbi:MAG TPA: hypothetical protein VIC27_13750, partial [Ktedonobacterales bacterium]
MTTPADGSGRLDEAATTKAPDAMNDAMNDANGSSGSHGVSSSGSSSKTRVAKEKKAARSKAEAAPVTARLPAVDLETQARPIARPTAPFDDSFDEPDEGATREVAAVSSGKLPSQPSRPARPMLEDSAPRADDPDATIMRAQPRRDAPSLDGLDGIDDQPMTEPAPPRRYNTLAGAFNRSRASASDPLAPAPAPSGPLTPPAPQMSDDDEYGDIVDEVDDDDEWALADQPTVQWTPQQIQQMQELRPDFLQADEQAPWPPIPDYGAVEPESDTSHHDWRTGLPPRPRPPFPLYGAPRPPAGGAYRLAAPDGRVAPEPPSASTAGAQPDPRMERFQELRQQRFAHGQDGERSNAEAQPVAEAVRQWWHDLRPNVQSALSYQR